MRYENRLNAKQTDRWLQCVCVVTLCSEELQKFHSRLYWLTLRSQSTMETGATVDLPYTFLHVVAVPSSDHKYGHDTNSLWTSIWSWIEQSAARKVELFITWFIKIKLNTLIRLYAHYCILPYIQHVSTHTQPSSGTKYKGIYVYIYIQLLGEYYINISLYLRYMGHISSIC